VGEGDDVRTADVALGVGATVRPGVRVGATVGLGVRVGRGVGVSSGHVSPGMHGGGVVGDGLGVGLSVGGGVGICPIADDNPTTSAAKSVPRKTMRRLIYISTTRWVSVERTPGRLWIRSRTTSARCLSSGNSQ
jgi:hypothetical protein